MIVVPRARVLFWVVHNASLDIIPSLRTLPRRGEARLFRGCRSLVRRLIGLLLADRRSILRSFQRRHRLIRELLKFFDTREFHLSIEKRWENFSIPDCYRLCVCVCVPRFFFFHLIRLSALWRHEFCV